MTEPVSGKPCCRDPRPGLRASFQASLILGPNPEDPELSFIFWNYPPFLLDSGMMRREKC